MFSKALDETPMFMCGCLPMQQDCTASAMKYICSMETESVILDVTCANGIWELTHHKIMSSDVFYAISTHNTNSSDCLGVDFF